MATVDAAPEKVPATLPIPVERLEKVINDTLGSSGKIVDNDCEIIAEGKGFLSVITRVNLTWADGSDTSILPGSVITKKPTLERIKHLPIISKYIDDVEILKLLHNRECDAYSIFLAHKPPPIPMACLYLAEKMTEESDSGILVLEDLSDGARSLSFNEDASFDQVMTLVGHIAKLHAYGFNHPEYKDVIATMPLDLAARMFDNDTVADAAAIRESYPDRFTMTDEDAMKFRNEVKDSFDIMINPEAHGYTSVLCLGDVQPNNILWKVNPDGSLSNEVAAFLDFQAANKGHCCWDIGGLLSMNVSHKDREAKEEKLFDHYLAILKADCNSGEPKIAIRELRELIVVQRKFQSFGALSVMKGWGELAPKMGITKDRELEIVDRMLAGLQKV